MGLDPRLTSLALLALAAKRAQARRQTPQRTVVLQIVYDATETEPPLDGPTYTYVERQGVWTLEEAADGTLDAV